MWQSRSSPQSVRADPGTKQRLIVDRQRNPLASLLTEANRHDSMAFEALTRRGV
jgi:hypothetical protein